MILCTTILNKNVALLNVILSVQLEQIIRISKGFGRLNEIIIKFEIWVEAVIFSECKNDTVFKLTKYFLSDQTESQIINLLMFFYIYQFYLNLLIFFK